MDGGGQDPAPREEEERAGRSEAPAQVGGGSEWAGRAEIDTSAPFESVREAVDRFGGSALWKSQLKQLFPPEKHYCFEEVEVLSVEEQAAQLEKDLIVKEKEALDVLKELEKTKKIMDGLKLKLQKETDVAKSPEINSDSTKVHPILETEELLSGDLDSHEDLVGHDTDAKQSPGFILTGLKQAMVNLSRATRDLVAIRASVLSLNGKIEKERALFERTREKLASNTAEVSFLEEELNRTKLKLQLIKGAENPLDISREIQKVTEAAKSKVSKLTAEIEQSKTSTKTAEIRWLAAKKMEEAAKAAEAVALAKIKDLMSGNTAENGVTLSVEEYVMLTRKAQEADEISRKKIEDAMHQVDEANRSKFELLTKVGEAAAEVITSRKALEEALKRLEAANRGKLAVEEALRRWRSEHAQKRRSVRSSTKFKNSYPIHNRRDPMMLDLNGPSLGPTLSIGQILSRKLSSPEGYEVETSERIHVEPKVSLGQILSKRDGILSPRRAEDGSSRKQLPAKRKKFGFVGFSLLLAKQNKRKKTRRARGPG